jgi:hypothetical protein
MIDNFKCQIKIEPLTRWFSDEFSPDGTCRPCRLKPLADLYLGRLQKEGTSEASTLEQAYEGGDILEIASVMDGIKERAKAPLRQDLEELDCLAQTGDQA